MEKSLDSALVWFRRDLRVDDHAALYHALRGGAPGLVRLRLRPRHPRSAAARRPAGRVHPRARRGARRRPRARSAAATATPACACSSATARPTTRSSRWPTRCTCRRCTPTTTTTRTRWRATPRVRGALADRGIALHTSKDHVVFERSEVLTGSGKPYSVFTPYKNAWLEKLDDFYLQRLPGRAPRGGAGAAAGRRRRRRCRRWPQLGFVSDQPATSSRSTAGSARRRGAARRLPASASTHYDDGARLPGGQGPELPRRAPALRHDLDPPAGARGARARRRAERQRAAPRPGSRS